MLRKKQSSNSFFISRVAGVAMGVVFVLLASWMQARIAPRVSVAGIPVGGLTLDQAAARLVATWERSSATFSDGSRSWQVYDRDAGVIFDAKSSVQRAYSVGRSGTLLDALRSYVFRQPVEAMVAVDVMKFDRFLATLVSKFGAPPIDASLIYEHGEFVILPGQDGVVIDREAVMNTMTDHIRIGSDEPIAVFPEIVRPMIGATDLESIRADADRLASVNLTVKTRSHTVALTRNDIGPLVIIRSLMSRSGKTVASLQQVPSSSLKALVDLDDGALRAYVERLAREHNIPQQPQQLLRSTNKVDVVRAGSAGSIIAANEAVSVLRAAIIAGAPSTIELPIVEVAPEVAYVEAPPAPIPTGKVIGVDLSKQMEYDYENGILVYSSKISSGINDWTPVGTFQVYAKTKKQKMSGLGYYVPNVPNILWFKGDYSLHGVYWHNDFGIRPRSHGCIGEPLDAAEWIYNWAEVGTPVVIYKS